MLCEAKSFDHVRVLQLSVAEAPPLEANQSCKAFGSDTPHCIVISLATVSIVGAVVSFKVIICVLVSATLPQASEMFQVLV